MCSGRRLCHGALGGYIPSHRPAGIHRCDFRLTGVVPRFTATVAGVLIGFLRGESAVTDQWQGGCGGHPHITIVVAVNTSSPAMSVLRRQLRQIASVAARRGAPQSAAVAHAAPARAILAGELRAQVSGPTCQSEPTHG